MCICKISFQVAKHHTKARVFLLGELQYRHSFSKAGICNLITKNVQRYKIAYLSIMCSSSISASWSLISSSEEIKLFHWNWMTLRFL